MQDYKHQIQEYLLQLVDVSKLDKQPFKAKAYQGAYNEIKKVDQPITSIEDISKIPKIGKSIHEKIKTIIEKGVLEVVNTRKEMLSEISELTRVHGIGTRKAEELFEKGITLKSLIQNEHLDELNDIQQKGLKYYLDFEKKIPRSEMTKHDEYLKNSIHVMDPSLICEVVGSYRRKKESSGDIDVLITHSQDSINDSTKLMEEIVEKMKKAGYIHDVFGMGKKKMLGVCKLKRHKTFRRLDFLITSKHEFPFALLYFTGNGDFNLKLRSYALSKGISLSEYGFKDVSTKTEKKMDDILTEEDIFKFLGLTYIVPEKRTDKINFEDYLLQN